MPGTNIQLAVAAAYRRLKFYTLDDHCLAWDVSSVLSFAQSNKFLLFVNMFVCCRDSQLRSVSGWTDGKHIKLEAFYIATYL